VPDASHGRPRLAARAARRARGRFGPLRGIGRRVRPVWPRILPEWRLARRADVHRRVVERPFRCPECGDRGAERIDRVIARHRPDDQQRRDRRRGEPDPPADSSASPVVAFSVHPHGSVNVTSMLLPTGASISGA